MGGGGGGGVENTSKCFTQTKTRSSFRIKVQIIISEILPTQKWHSCLETIPQLKILFLEFSSIVQKNKTRRNETFYF